ncbi:MAG: hypothetical protein V1944_02070 [Candidatus Aenigmatarchaeota archaeon]
MRKLIPFIIFALLVPLAFAQFQVTHPGLKFTNYQTTLTQPPGTSSTYTMNVSNTGDVRLDKVYLSLSFLPSTWYEIGGSEPLGIGETGEFTYKIKLPEDASGSIDLDLTAHGIRGFGEVTKTSVKIKLVSETILPTQTETITTTTTATTMIKEKDFISSNVNYIVIILIVLILVTLAVILRS